MENPYKYSAGPAPATPEAQQLTDYEAAIGSNLEYYLRRFEEFDRGGAWASWHWPAFFATSPWYLYRKMWLPGILNLVWPFILLVFCGIAFAAFRQPVEAHPVVFTLLFLALLAVPWFVLPIYANALYWRHIRNLIARLPRSVAQAPDKRVARLTREGGTGVGPMIGACLGLGFFLVSFVGGMVAAIAIPAAQDYTIRAQVAEGLKLAAPRKAQVAEYWAQNRHWPDQADFGTEMPSSMYVRSVGVAGGSVVVTYGNAANPLIGGQRIALVPGVDARGDVHWSCGNASHQPGVTPGEGTSGSDLADKYLPRDCRAVDSGASRP